MAFIPDEQTAGFIPDEPSGFIPDKPELPTGGGLAEFGKSFVKGTMDVGKGLLGTIQTMHPDPLARYIMKPKVAEAKRKIASAQERFPVTHRGAEAWVGRVLGGAIPYMGAALAGGAAVGPVGAAVVGFSVEGDNAYDDAIASGASENQAQTERLVVGSINAGIEAWQIGKIMKFAKSGKHSLKNFIRLVRKKSFKKAGKLAKNFGADVLRLSLEEGLEEFSQEGVSLGVPAAFRGERPTKPDGTTDWLAVGERLGEAALGGAVAGPILGGGMRVLTGQGGTAQPAPQDIPPGSNVYQTDKGRIVIETPSDIGDKASQKTELKDGLVIDKATGETLTQVTEGTVSGRLDAPKLGKTKIPAFVIEPDEVKTNEPEFSDRCRTFDW
jgi:hypothetical protein